MLVEKVARKLARDPFFHVVFRDSTDSTPAKVWSIHPSILIATELGG